MQLPSYYEKQLFNLAFPFRNQNNWILMIFKIVHIKANTSKAI